MRGESHLLMSLIVSLPTFFVLYGLSSSTEYRNGIILIMIGILVGSLLPDLDAPDAKIMHGWWRPIGFIGRHLFYRPLARLLRWGSEAYRDEHRGFLHSLTGCIFASLFFAVILIVLSAFLWFAWYISLGIPVGFLLHLVEDSFTKSGVMWFFPWGVPIRGEIRMHSGGEYSLLTISFITFGSLTAVEFYLLPANIATVLLSVGLTLVLLASLYRANPRVSRLGDKRYSLRELVGFYVEDRGGKKVDKDESCVATLRIASSGDLHRRHRLARITGVGIYGPERDWLAPCIEAGRFQEGDVIEMQTSEEGRGLRVYYAVQNGLFCPFLKQPLRDL